MDMLRLTETRNITQPYYNLSGTDLSKQYQPGKWNVKQILVNQADAETVLPGRNKTIVAEPCQV